MRQVPVHYLIIGSGRMAAHFSHYLRLLDISYQQWSRKADPQRKTLPDLITHSSSILVLINDSAIEDFIKLNPLLQNKTVIHFSGCLTTSLAHGAHPLMTFSNELYDLPTYQKIPFVMEQGGPTFTGLFPNLKNPHFMISKELKPLYHSLCVLSGNFTSLLWQKFFTELEKKFNLPKEIAFPYLEQVFKNLLQNPEKALTGPIARNDKAIIASNLQALKDDPVQKIYQAFVETFSSIKN